MNMALSRRVLLFSQQCQHLKNSGETITFVRWMSKHYNPKFKWLRKMKYINPGIEFDKKFTKEEKERMYRERGIIPRRPAKELPIYIQSSLDIFDPYVPLEGDGKYTSLTERVTKAINISQGVMKKGKNMMAIRKIRKYIVNFDENEFANTALDIYIKAHTALASNDIDELEKYATDNAINLMTMNTENKTIRWKYIESLDPPATVHARVAAVGTEENVFAQITVRFHSKQMLAIYDRFGRLMYGTEILAKDVLEYCVFEIHLTNLNGSYKIHHKIIPDSVAERYSISRTYHKPEEAAEIDDAGEEYKVISEADDEQRTKTF